MLSGMGIELSERAEDMIKRGEDKVQDMTNAFNKKVEDILKVKESEIMTV